MELLWRSKTDNMLGARAMLDAFACAPDPCLPTILPYGRIRKAAVAKSEFFLKVEKETLKNCGQPIPNLELSRRVVGCLLWLDN
jgi:hypothetical protein